MSEPEAQPGQEAGDSRPTRSEAELPKAEGRGSRARREPEGER